MDERAMLRWITLKLKEDKIKSVTRNVLDKLIEKFPHVGVVFVDDENKAELEIINQLESGVDVIREEELIVVQVSSSYPALGVMETRARYYKSFSGFN